MLQPKRFGKSMIINLFSLCLLTQLLLPKGFATQDHPCPFIRRISKLYILLFMVFMKNEWALKLFNPLASRREFDSPALSHPVWSEAVCSNQAKVLFSFCWICKEMTCESFWWMAKEITKILPPSGCRNANNGSIVNGSPTETWIMNQASSIKLPLTK